MKRYGILVEDKDGNRLTDIKIEITDFEMGFEGEFPIFDSGITDHIGFVALDPKKNMIKRKERNKRISELFAR